IYNRTPESSRAAAHAIRTALAERSALGAITPAAAAAAAGRLVDSLDVVQAGGNAEFVVEAVPEDLDLKREMYRRIEEVGEPDARGFRRRAGGTPALPVESRPARLIPDRAGGTMPDIPGCTRWLGVGGQATGTIPGCGLFQFLCPAIS